jgi:hypothetical protein
MAAGTSALLIAIGGGAAGIAALTRSDPKPRVVTAVGDAAAPDAMKPDATAPDATGPDATGPDATAPDATTPDATIPGAAASGAAAADGTQPAQPLQNPVGVPGRTPAGANRAVSRNPIRPPAPAKAGPGPVVPPAKPAAQPAITTRTETVTREIPYASRIVRDPGLPRGSKRVQTPGVAGEETLRYLVTLTGGRPTARRLIGSTVTRQPQPEVVAVGDGTDPCGADLDLCVPIGRDPWCRHHRRDESADGSGAPSTAGSATSTAGSTAASAAASTDGGGNGQIGVSGNDLALLSGGQSAGPGGGLDGGLGGGTGGGWHVGGRGRGC